MNPGYGAASGKGFYWHGVFESPMIEALSGGPFDATATDNLPGIMPTLSDGRYS